MTRIKALRLTIVDHRIDKFGGSDEQNAKEYIDAWETGHFYPLSECDVKAEVIYLDKPADVPIQALVGKIAAAI